MDKIIVSITDRNGNNPVVNGYEITPDELVDYIKADGLSIDQTKLIGSDNFTVDAKRLKCNLVLPNNNSLFKNSILSLLNDDTRLLNDSLETTNVGAIVVDKNLAQGAFSVESLFGSDYFYEGDYQTWSDEYAGDGKLILKSTKLTKIIMAMCWNYFTKKSNNCPGYGYFATSDAGDLETDNIRNTADRGVTIDGYHFDVGFMNLSDFIAYGMLKYKGYANDSIHKAYGEYFVDYLEGIKTNFGALIENNVMASIYANFHGNSSTLNVNHIFTKNWERCENSTSYESLKCYAWEKIDYWLCRDIGIALDLHFYTVSTPYGATPTLVDIGRYDTIAPAGFTNKEKMVYRLAHLISALIQYSWYDSALDDFVSGGYAPCHLSYSRFSSYVPFNNCMEAVCGIIHARNTPNLMPQIKYNIFHNEVIRSLNQYIKCLSPLKYLHENNYCTFGKPKIMTRTSRKTDESEINNNVDDTILSDSGFEIVQLNPDELPDDKIFTPVMRVYYFKPSKFYAGGQVPNVAYDLENDTQLYLIIAGGKKIFIDEFDYANFVSNPANASYLATTGYSETTWMYFNNIGIVEKLIAYNPDTPAGIDRVEIPVFDAQDGDSTDNYGLYLYRDYFESYYTKNKSKLMDLYINVAIESGGNLTNIYRGAIDFETVSSNKTSISFDAIDAMGVLIENLDKLGDAVCFSQHDIANGYSFTAIKAAGSTPKGFIDGIIRSPFPYNFAMGNNIFALPDEAALQNKVLKDVNASDMLVTAIQISKVLLYCDNNGRIQIDVFDPAELESYSEIDGDILTMELSRSILSEKFSIDKIKNVAGWDVFGPVVAAYYNSIRNECANIVSLDIVNQETEIKILDKIWIDGICYVVTEINCELRK